MISAFVPNCRVTVLDVTFVDDDNGDAKPDERPVAEHLPAFWAQKNQRTQDPATGRWSVVKGYRVLLRPGTVVTENNRVRRESDGLTAQVNAVSNDSPLAVAGDVVVRALAITR